MTKNEKIWRIMSTIWGVLALTVVVADFYCPERFDYLLAPINVIYIGVLGIYAGTKEFSRWYEEHEGRHPGELFVIFWTVVVIFLAGAAFWQQQKMPSETVASYLAVLSIFAITQKSKRMFHKKFRKK